MKVKIYDTVKAFLEDNEEILLEKEAITQLFLGNSYANIEKSMDKDNFFGIVQDDNKETQLIFCNVSPYNLLVHIINDNYKEAINVLVNYLVEEDIPIGGINARKAVCDDFIKNYGDKTKKLFKERSAMDIMEIRKLNNRNILAKGFFRVATMEDLSLLINWHINFTRDALHEDSVYEDFKEKLLSRIENKTFFIFEDESHKPVSMAAATRQLKNGVSISLVYTDREERGKGYGFAVVYNLSKLYLERGNKFCTLFVDKRNPISNAVYKKIGYEVLEDNYDYRIV